MSDDSIHIVHGMSAEQVAVEYAKQHRLPLGATMTITDIHGRPQHFEVERSTLSNNLKDGGELKITRGAPALQGGGRGAAAYNPLERDHVIHARDARHAAMLFAQESGVPSGTDLYVTSPDGKEGMYFTTH